MKDGGTNRGWQEEGRCKTWEEQRVEWRMRGEKWGNQMGRNGNGGGVTEGQLVTWMEAKHLRDQRWVVSLCVKVGLCGCFMSSNLVTVTVCGDRSLKMKGKKTKHFLKKETERERGGSGPLCRGLGIRTCWNSHYVYTRPEICLSPGSMGLLWIQVGFRFSKERIWLTQTSPLTVWWRKHQGHSLHWFKSVHTGVRLSSRILKHQIKNTVVGLR